MSGCERGVLSSLVTFNVHIDVLSTHQRGHSHGRERRKRTRVCGRQGSVQYGGSFEIPEQALRSAQMWVGLVSDKPPRYRALRGTQMASG